jgi:hypothetical protein
MSLRDLRVYPLPPELQNIDAARWSSTID